MLNAEAMVGEIADNAAHAYFMRIRDGWLSHPHVESHSMNYSRRGCPLLPADQATVIAAADAAAVGLSGTGSCTTYSFWIFYDIGILDRL